MDDGRKTTASLGREKAPLSIPNPHLISTFLARAYRVAYRRSIEAATRSRRRRTPFVRQGELRSRQRRGGEEGGPVSHRYQAVGTLVEDGRSEGLTDGGAPLFGDTVAERDSRGLTCGLPHRGYSQAIIRTWSPSPFGTSSGSPPWRSARKEGASPPSPCLARSEEL
jgi:hypothetical protein